MSGDESSRGSESTKSLLLRKSTLPETVGTPRIHSRCPHCHELVEADETRGMVELTCRHCGGTFNFMTAETCTLTAGATISIGRFQLVEELGSGSFGRVWKARDCELDRFVAIKIPHRAALDDEEAERWMREARAAAQLNHPGIVSVHEVIRDGGLIYIISDFVQAATLQDWMLVRTPTARQAVQLMVALAEAMDYAHQQGVVHRDLKPANILIDGQGLPHITDFGLAKRDKAEVTVTIDGQVLGTPSYMSPQQASGQGHHVDGRTDVYSLGVILFQLLTRELPFRGSSRMIILQILHDEPPSPRKLKAGIASDLNTITLKCLEKDPSRRYQTAGEFAADLKRWLAGEPILARPVSQLERAARWCRRNPVVAALAASLAVLLVLVAVSSAAYSMRLARYAEREHQARTEAETYFRMTLAAIDEMLTEVGQESLSHVPQMEQVRKRLLEKALGLHQQLVATQPSHPGLQLEFARAQHRMGDLYDLLGEHAQARHAYEQAIQACERLRAAAPNDLQVRHQWAKSQTMLGETCRRTAPDQADEHYAAAQSIQEELHRLKPGQQEFQRELSRTLNNRGLLLTETNQYPLAEIALRNAIRHLQELTHKDPRSHDYASDLARAQINLGVLLNKQPGRVGEAEAAYLEAIRNLQRLVDEDSSNREFRRKLGVAMLDLGNLLYRSARQSADSPQAAEQRQQAVSWTRQAGTTLGQLRDDFPGIPLYHYEAANAHNSLANALVGVGEFESARTEFERAQGFLQALGLEFPEYELEVGEFQSLQGVVLGSLAAFKFEIDHDPQAALPLVEQATDYQQRALALAPSNPIFAERLAAHEAYREKIRSSLGSDAPPP